MQPLRRCLFVAGALVLLLASANPAPGQDRPKFSSDGNRLTYLDENDPFYPHLKFPRLVTPQWIGEAGVEAVVILSIDDMRETERYEKFLRPIFERLKQIDGRAPVSIMINAIAPTNAQLQAWLKEGLSLEVHTLAHPCPCLAKGDFSAAANTYHGCVELINQIPVNRPVAFRMPCCDSMNSPSPRFYAEIFDRTNSAGQFLTIDSSVMNIPTAKDIRLPRDLVLEGDGRERFRKYLPTETNATTKVSMKSFTTTIEDYPYPYVIGNHCWELPATVPSDWEAFNLHGSTNPVTLADWKAALDITVLKQGVFPIIFHPHGWSSPQQFVELIDYAMQKHGRKVKFLTFREAQERLDRNLLEGEPLRTQDGGDNGVRVLDVNNDGFMDVVVGNRKVQKTRVWRAADQSWSETGFPSVIQARVRDGEKDRLVDLRFGVFQPDGSASIVSSSRTIDRPNERIDELFGSASRLAWHFVSNRWEGDGGVGNWTNVIGIGRDLGYRCRDFDRDGRCELLLGDSRSNGLVVTFTPNLNEVRNFHSLPSGASVVDADGRDNGLRFVDVNGDGYDDVLVSNEKEFSLHLYVVQGNKRLMFDPGWNDEVWSGRRPGGGSIDIPLIVRDGAYRNNGVWFRDGMMWVQNEDTAHLPDKVDRRTFRQLLTADQPPAMSPEQSLAAMRPRPGFKVELVAAEPLVQDPIAFEWGADGKLWVVEMGDYPLGLDGKGQSGGRIKFLEDLDGDGRYDKATVFLDHVNFPTGVMPWRRGVLVSAAPEIFYAEDTDGDGKADLREALFTGFKEGNQQHRVNGFEYGLDNWIYCANGESGGTITVAAGVRRLWERNHPNGGDQSLLTSTLRSAATEDGSAATNAVSISGRDFRFRPDDGIGEAVAGTTQYGRHRDDWGNWFGNNNPVWLWHFHIPEHYLERNPHLAVKTTRHFLADYPNGTRLFPASRTRQRFNDHHQFNHVTSANSATPYRDELFGPAFATSVFISDPVHNLVHREVLEPAGVSFTSHRAPDETNSEFLACADNWFRPTMLKTGPDGALYIADMYREVLEHPEWIPAFIQPRLDIRAGADKGRIYRVYPANATLQKCPRLDTLDAAGLTAALDSPNGWQRDMAQRLLVDGRHFAAAIPLRQLLDHARDETRLQALCTLEGLGQLKPDDLIRALRDPHPAIREHATRASEPLLSSVRERPGGLTDALLQLEEDPQLRVRYQLAFTLGRSDDPRVGGVLARIALRDAGVSEMQTAVMSSATNHLGEMLDFAFIQGANRPGASRLIEQLVGLAAALKDARVLASALTRLAEPGADGKLAPNFAAFAAFLDGIGTRDPSSALFAGFGGNEMKDALKRLTPLFAAARTVAFDDGADVGQRRAAIRLLGRAADEADARRLGELLHPQYASDLQHEAVSALGHRNDAQTAQILLAGWRGESPGLRMEVITALLSRPAWVQTLLAAVEGGQIPPGQINAAVQQKLLKHPEGAIRGRAEKLFAITRPDRQELLKEYAGVARLRGDAERGFAIFKQNCVICHRWRGEGSDVGPELAGLADKSLQTLLVAILDPNQAVEDRYVSYTATTKAGRELSGIVISETPNSLALRAPGGQEETLLRRDLEELSGSGLSLMPEGFEKALKPQDMADLIATLSEK